MEEKKKLRSITARSLQTTRSLLRMFRIFLLALGVVTFSAANVQSASSSDYPRKPIRVVVTTSAGGAVDMVARTVTPKMSQLLGQQIIVDNREGGGGVIGYEMVAKAPPDGYTLALTGNNFVTNAVLYKKLPFDSVKDFAFISNIANGSSVLVVNPSLPVKNVKDFIALAKTWPGGLKCSNAGRGSNAHLGAEFFNSVTGAKMVHVSYKGGAPAFVAVMSGEVQAQFAQLPQAVEAGGKVRTIAQGGKTRSPVLPDVPTFIESGLRDFILVSTNGLAAPAGTPRAIIDRVRGALVDALNDPEVRKRLASVGTDPVGSTPEEMEEFIKSEIATWTKVARGAGIEQIE